MKTRPAAINTGANSGKTGKVTRDQDDRGIVPRSNAFQCTPELLQWAKGILQEAGRRQSGCRGI